MSMPIQRQSEAYGIFDDGPRFARDRANRDLPRGLIGLINTNGPRVGAGLLNTRQAAAPRYEGDPAEATRRTSRIYRAGQECEYCGRPGHDWTRHPEAHADVAEWERERHRQEFPFGDYTEPEYPADDDHGGEYWPGRNASRLPTAKADDTDDGGWRDFDEPGFDPRSDEGPGYPDWLRRNRGDGDGGWGKATREARIAVNTDGMDPDSHAYHQESYGGAYDAGGHWVGDEDGHYTPRREWNPDFGYEMTDEDERNHELVAEDDESGYNWGPEPTGVPGSLIMNRDARQRSASIMDEHFPGLYDIEPSPEYVQKLQEHGIAPRDANYMGRDLMDQYGLENPVRLRSLRSRALRDGWNPDHFEIAVMNRLERGKQAPDCPDCQSEGSQCGRHYNYGLNMTQGVLHEPGDNPFEQVEDEQGNILSEPRYKTKNPIRRVVPPYVEPPADPNSPRGINDVAEVAEDEDEFRQLARLAAHARRLASQRPGSRLPFDRAAGRRLAEHDDLPPLPDDFHVPDSPEGQPDRSPGWLYRQFTAPHKGLWDIPEHELDDRWSKVYDTLGFDPQTREQWESARHTDNPSDKWDGGMDGIFGGGVKDYLTRAPMSKEEYARHREDSKNRAQQMADGLWNAMYPPEEEEGRKAVQHMDTVNKLMSHGWQPEHIKYDEDDEPYALYQHPSGWNIKDYGGAYKEIGHAATPGETHDAINVSRYDRNTGESHNDLFGPHDAHNFIENQLHGDPEETGGAFQYLTQDHPAIRKYKPRQAARTAACQSCGGGVYHISGEGFVHADSDDQNGWDIDEDHRAEPDWEDDRNLGLSSVEGWYEQRHSMRLAKDGERCTCWEGYERVPGTEPCASGSCRRKRGKDG